MQTQTNIHDAKIDPRNLDILISVNGKLVPRAEAMVSVFDSGFILGDGVWEGLRLVKGGVPFLREHIERLYEGAKAIFMDIGLTPRRTGAAPVRLPRRQPHGGRRPHPPDGHARRQGHTLPGPARDDRQAHHRHHPRIQDAQSGEDRRRASSLHTVHVHRGAPGRAGPEAQLAFEAQLHHRLHPGRQCRCGRSADARSAWASSPPATPPISSSCAAASCGPRPASTASPASRAAT